VISKTKIQDLQLGRLSEKLLDDGLSIRCKAEGNSMYPFLKAGDRITIEKADSEQISVGDVIVFAKDKTWIIHRVLKIIREHNRVVFLCRGDAVKKMDEPVSPAEIIGKVIAYCRNGITAKLDSPELKRKTNLVLFFNPILPQIIRVIKKIKN
jgi:signal peptidase I